MSEARNWRIQLSEHGRGDRPPRWLHSWQGDGLIARIENRQIEKAILEKGIPTINVSASGLAQNIPSVISNSSAVAQLALDHLYERGFRNHLQRSPYEMIQQIRFQRAESLLRESSLTIAEISERSGFLTPQYFSAIFKKRYNVSPKAFRDRLRTSYKKL